MHDPGDLSDEQLVEKVRDENHGLYRHIVERYEQKLRRYAMTFVHDTEVADDVLQNAFMKAYINLWGFNTKKKFSSWIYRIVHNEAINEIKKRKKELYLEDTPEAEMVESTEDGADVTTDGNRTKEMLEQSLERLPLMYREPLVLYYLEERSYQEIVDILHMPVGTVGTRIRRGLALLTKIVEDHHSPL